MKRSFILAGILLSGFFVLTSESCGKKDPEPDLSKGYPDAFTNKLPEKRINQIKKAGGTIHEGQDPPSVNGIFDAYEFIYKASDGKRVGEVIGLSGFQFIMDSNPAIKACAVDWSHWDEDGGLIESAEGGGDVYFPMSGHDFNFTVIGVEQITDDKTGKKEDYHSTYTGKLTDKGIENWESSLFTVDTNGDINWIRFFRDTDNFAPREVIKPNSQRVSIPPVIQNMWNKLSKGKLKRSQK